MQLFNSLRDVRANYPKYDEWEQKQADEKAKKAYAAKNIEIPKDELELTTAKAKAVVRATEIMDKRSEDNTETTEMATSSLAAAVVMASSMLASTFSAGKNSKVGLVLQSVVPMLSSIGLIVWGNSKQKEASRIGRYQAKHNELKNVKNFVTYTPEQISAAKILADNMPDKKDKKGLLHTFNEMKEISKDKKAYRAWLEERIKNPDDIEKLLNTEFAPEQIEQGKQDKELIVNIVKDINIKAEEYSENTETMFDTISNVSFLASVPLAFGMNKLLSNIKSLPKSVKMATAPIASLAVVLGTAIWGTMEQKKASKIGRYKARQELLNHPELLRSYPSEDIKNAEKAISKEEKTSKPGKLKQMLSFYSTYKADKKAYKEYEKTEKKEHEKIYDVLIDSEVSDKQIEDAKHLQEKVYLAFDEIDEMSQKYSEDVEAATEIGKQLIATTASFGGLLGLASVPLLIVKGKFPVHKVIKGISNIALDKSSSIKKIIDDVYNVVKKDKDLKETLCKSIYDPTARTNLLSNEALQTVFAKYTDELKEMSSILVGENSDTAVKELMDVHFKKGKVASWARNLVKDVVNIVARVKGIKPSLPSEANETVLETVKKNYKEYKTIINTGIVAASPALSLIFAVPLAINSWFTSIQKKAGKIGIMKAMEKIDDPKLFVNPNSQADSPQKESEPKTTNLIDILSMR